MGGKNYRFGYGVSLEICPSAAALRVIDLHATNFGTGEIGFEIEPGDGSLQHVGSLDEDEAYALARASSGFAVEGEGVDSPLELCRTP